MSLKYSKAEIKTWSRILEILRIIEIFQLSRQILEIPQNPKIPQKSRYCRICLQNTISAISVPIRVSYILFDTHLGKKRRKRKVKIDRKRGKKGEFIKKGWRFTTNHAVFSSKNINCVAFPRGSPLYEVITRRGIMGWFSKVKGTLEGIFSLIMRTGQKAAKETSHRLCLHGQLFKVTVPANCIRPRQTILLLYE